MYGTPPKRDRLKRNFFIEKEPGVLPWSHGWSVQSGQGQSVIRAVCLWKMRWSCDFLKDTGVISRYFGWIQFFLKNKMLGLAILIDYILCLFWVQQWQPKINPTERTRTSIYIYIYVSFITICKDPTVAFFPALLYFSMINQRQKNAGRHSGTGHVDIFGYQLHCSFSRI